MEDKDKKVGLVTGGVGDLGYACAQKMADMGLDLVLIDIRENDERVAELRERGARVLFVNADVSSREAVQAAVEKVWAEFGWLDVCMCNAGISMNVPFLDYTVEQWNQHMDVNLNGYFHVTQ